MSLDLTDIPDDFGSGGANLSPGGGNGEPTLKDILVEHKEALETLDGSSGGLSTVTTSGLITGDGSSGLPVKLADVATSTIIGRSTAGTGTPEVLSAATARTTLGLGTLATQSGTFSGTSSGTNTGDQTITLTGAVTGSGTGSFATTIPAASITETALVEQRWSALRHPAILTLAPTLTKITPFRTASVSTDLEQTAAVGSATTTVSITEDGGVIVTKTGVTSGSSQFCQQVGAAAGGRIISNIKTHPWAIAMRVKVATTIDSAGTFNLFMNSTLTSVGLTFRGSISTTNWVLGVFGSGNTTVDTTQAVDVGVYHNIAVVFDTAKLWLVYDDVANATGITDLTNFDTSAGFLRFYTTNGGTSANREARVSEIAVYTPQAV